VSDNLYISIKVKGVDSWMTFRKDEVERNGTLFKGKNGWGKNKATINFVSVQESLIEGESLSDNIMA